MPFTDKEIVKLVKKGVAAELKGDTATRREIIDLVKRGVAAELKAPIGTTGISPAQGAQAAVNVQDALAKLTQQVADLTALVQALPGAPTGRPTGTRKPTGTRTPTGTRAPGRSRTPAGTGVAPADGRG